MKVLDQMKLLSTFESMYATEWPELCSMDVEDVIHELRRRFPKFSDADLRAAFLSWQARF